MKKIDHIAIAVNSLEESVKLFNDLLEAEPKLEYVPDEKVNTAVYRLAGASLELVEPASDNSPISEFLEKRGSGLHHICFQVEDINSAISLLQKKGFELIDEKPKKGSGGTSIVFLHPKSTGGVLIELNSKPEGEAEDAD